MLPDIVLSFRLASRARIALAYLLMVCVIGLFVFLASMFSARQPATVALDVGLSLARLIVPILIVFLAQELINKEFMLRYYLVSLTYPRQREFWLLSRFISTYIIGIGMLFVLAVILALEVKLIGSGYEQSTNVNLGTPYIITIGLMSIDIFVITAVACLFAVTARTPSFIAIGTVGFMIVARSYSHVINLLSNNIDPTISQYVDQGTYTTSLSLLRFIVPDLAALDLRYLALYDSAHSIPDDIPWLLISTFGYGVVILALASWWVNRRAMN